MNRTTDRTEPTKPHLRLVDNNNNNYWLGSGSLQWFCVSRFPPGSHHIQYIGAGPTFQTAYANWEKHADSRRPL